MAAFRAAIAQARPAAGFVGDVVLEVALAGGPAADRAGAGRVADLGQVPQLDPGIVALGLEPVIAVLGRKRVQGDEQVRSVSRNAQLPGAVSAGGPSWLVAVKSNPGPSRFPVPPGGPGPARLRWFLGPGRAQPCPMACPSWSVTVTHHVDRGLRAAAAARSRARAGSTGPIPGSPRAARLVLHGGQRHGQGHPRGEPARRRARSRGTAGPPGPARRCPARRGLTRRARAAAVRA